jgi:hypothetical protein
MLSGSAREQFADVLVRVTIQAVHSVLRLAILTANK